MRSLILFFLLVFNTAYAQTFNYSAALPGVDSTAFYKIKISPEIKSKLKPGMADLRVYDDSNKEIPYILKSDREINFTSIFKTYSIISKTILRDSISQIIIGKDSSRISSIGLVVRNADVEKEVKLSGSFNRQQWFVVKDFQLIQAINNTRDVSSVLNIDFPLSDYTFYKIEINDKYAAPVDIINVGYFQTETLPGNYTPLNATFYATDSAHRKMSFLTMQWNEVRDIDAIELNIRSPQNYRRSASLYSIWNDGHKWDTKKYIGDIIISSKAPLRFTIPGIRSKHFYIEIRNRDDAPLEIEKAEAFQLNHYCIAQLEKNKKYNLRFGNSMADFPVYDLNYFEHLIPSQIKTILPGAVLDVSIREKTEKKQPSFFENKEFIWGALSSIVILLAFVTWRMLKEMK